MEGHPRRLAEMGWRHRQFCARRWPLRAGIRHTQLRTRYGDATSQRASPAPILPRAGSNVRLYRSRAAMKVVAVPVHADSAEAPRVMRQLGVLPLATSGQRAQFLAEEVEPLPRTPRVASHS